MSAKHNFCTLFDSNYLSRALVMYHSLKKTGDEFELYAVCFDDMAYQILIRLELPNLIAIPLHEFESSELLGVKEQRTAGEYCWTCTPHVIRYALDTYKLPEVTYLDADLCFYDKPSLLLSELEECGKSVLITEHRYTPRYDQSATSGIYCVQFMTFRADERGLKVLQWWQDRCIEWCYARYEDGKFGDQKYLDDWTQRFEGIHVLQHIGGGAAPWNVQRYAFEQNDRGGIEVDGAPLVFFHFHGYRHYRDGTHDLGNYWLGRSVIDLLYRPYAFALFKANMEITGVYPGFDRGRPERPRSWKTPLRKLKRYLKGNSMNTDFNEEVSSDEFRE